MKKYLEEFKEFIARGDVMSMAVGIIIGGAFTSIVNSLVSDVITPFIGIITGGIDFTGLSLSFGNAHIMIGNFIQAIIIFLITAFVIFSIMKMFNAFSRKKEEPAEDPKDPEPTVEEQTLAVLKEIRDELGKN
jgi:large conductance mechanosensitive channel